MPPYPPLLQNTPLTYRRRARVPIRVERRRKNRPLYGVLRRDSLRFVSACGRRARLGKLRDFWVRVSHRVTSVRTYGEQVGLKTLGIERWALRPSIPFICMTSEALDSCRSFGGRRRFFSSSPVSERTPTYLEHFFTVKEAVLVER